MAKDPAFPFYAQDYLVDTLRWDREMKAMHIDLLCEAWINGPLRDNSGYPFGLTTVEQGIWDRIKHKWSLSPDGWVSAKMEEVRAQRKAFIDKQRIKGKKSAEKRRGLVQPEADSGSTVVEPNEKENEKEDIKNNTTTPGGDTRGGKSWARDHKLKEKIIDAGFNNLMKLTELTPAECEKLKATANNDLNLVWMKVEALENKKDATKLYKSAYLTLNNWIKMAITDKKTTTVTGNENPITEKLEKDKFDNE